jgi:hypothetical protein
MASVWGPVWQPVWGRVWLGPWAADSGPSNDALLLENGGYLLLETGDYLLLESIGAGYEAFVVDDGINFLVDDGSGGSELFGVLE